MGNHKVLKGMRYSMYEFIDAVKVHPIIWNREHEDFHNRELRDQAWQKIGQKLCKNFDAATAAEKLEIAKTLLKRWKNTRDSFLRVNRLRQSGEETGRASYIYEKELSFLLDAKQDSIKEDPKTPAPAKRKRFGILRSETKRRSSGPAQEDDEGGLHAVLDSLPYTEDASTLPEGAQGTSAHNISALAKNETSTFSMDFTHSSVNSSSTINAQTPLVTSDPDQAFFESIKPHMQNMTSDQKLEFQIEVLKILRNFKPKPN
ncbi:uncharacterized protein LOC115624475 [Scaptodrosophila lebanonensis]|uniref:Uncharacterized protein LOC115624162 n=1 Tax=Drosophila lebanonensis TaxID=7225 RepID=A0A6J2TIU2_DROLE|nr:uncharacterized protein LOC115624162 [Scaptodrosophila lebanonensis]XP_030375038.1 uncharacterized protein LOC115624475 [Scaptodrosophila lebanonensis]